MHQENIVDAEKTVVSKPIKSRFPWSLYFNARRQAINKWLWIMLGDGKSCEETL